jgi:predicted nucleic acid-binding protein
LRTPDALQAATAVHAGATGLITNDPVFERVEGLETLVLESLL